MRLRVRRSGPLRGDLGVPGDKSVSHRALILAALADGETVVDGFSGGEDNQRTAAALRAMGVDVAEGGDRVRVRGVGLHGLRPAADVLDCGNSGTTMRLLCGLLCGQGFAARLDGDETLRRRPMRRVAEPLERMGGRLRGAPGARPGDLYAPLVVDGLAPGTRLAAIDYALPVASAQVKGAVLLAGLFARGVTRVRERGPARDHTDRMMAYLGLPLRRTPGAPSGGGGQGWPPPWAAAEIDGGAAGRFAARPITVPGDLSSAAFLLAAAALVPGSRVRVRGCGVNPTRSGILDVLARMGVAVARGAERDESGEPVADLAVAAADLGPTTVAGDLTVRAIDEVPIIAALATRAAGVTEIRDASELRVKESDRLAVMAGELRRLGAEIEELPDGLRVAGPARLRGAACRSHGDHRIAMALAVAALVAEGETVVEEADNIATSYPGFVDALGALGADIRSEP
ncbi:MAG: 3-phosphoshikimate 1-carboxyvinyltransferase [Deltaproteobacteria bacterium]|nr:3-phosphoshikimate 1-carboxyvinyltransferase [Deltaproteobacteria bacterium]